MVVYCPLSCDMERRVTIWRPNCVSVWTHGYNPKLSSAWHPPPLHLLVSKLVHRLPIVVISHKGTGWYLPTPLTFQGIIFSRPKCKTIWLISIFCSLWLLVAYLLLAMNADAVVKGVVGSYRPFLFFRVGCFPLWVSCPSYLKTGFYITIIDGRRTNRANG